MDHSYDPVLAIEQMLDVTKSGGAVVLIHSPNEGSDAHYLGLHQWNFKNINGDFVISSPWRPTVNLSDRLRDRADIVVGSRPSDESIVVTMVKHNPVAASLRGHSKKSQQLENKTAGTVNFDQHHAVNHLSFLVMRHFEIMPNNCNHTVA